MSSSNSNPIKNNNLQLAIIDKRVKNESYSSSLTMYTAGSIVGASVSAIVYSSIVTSGDITGSLIQTGINLGGSILGYGTELLVGSIAGNSVRGIAAASGAIAGPTISSSTRTIAVGLSVIAGAISAITTSTFLYGAKEAGYYIYTKIEDYKHQVAEKIQHPIAIDNDLVNEILETGVLLNDSDSQKNSLGGEPEIINWEISS